MSVAIKKQIETIRAGLNQEVRSYDQDELEPELKNLLHVLKGTPFTYGADNEKTDFPRDVPTGAKVRNALLFVEFLLLFHIQSKKKDNG